MVSIHAFRGEGDPDARFRFRAHRVSIHAFRGEGDSTAPRASSRHFCFNPRLPGGRRRDAAGGVSQHAVVSIHAFRGEGDSCTSQSGQALSAFQSTPSGGKATPLRLAARPAAARFNPRLPGGRRPTARWSASRPSIVSIHAFRGEGDAGIIERRTLSLDVSIHAFRGEGDRGGTDIVLDARGFNPRLPGGRRHHWLGQLVNRRVVSIHAFRGEGDPTRARGAGGHAVSIHAFRGEGDREQRAVPVPALCFNPRLPGGRRRDIYHIRPALTTFQSTPSGGKATGLHLEPVDASAVSIHAFRGEGDIISWVNSLIDVWFQSTPSGGKATPNDHQRHRQPHVSIHAFRGEGDRNI